MIKTSFHFVVCVFCSEEQSVFVPFHLWGPTELCGDMGTRKRCWHCNQASSRVTVASIGAVPPPLKRPRPVNSNLASSCRACRHHRTAVRTSETLWSCLVSRHNTLCFPRAMTGRSSPFRVHVTCGCLLFCANAPRILPEWLRSWRKCVL